jgi:hypothetical protein
MNVRASVLKTSILPILTNGCKVWGKDSTSGVNKLQILFNQRLKSLVGVGSKVHGVANTPLLRELGIAPMEATAATARSRAFLQASTLNTCISDSVGQPSRLRPNTWT